MIKTGIFIEGHELTSADEGKVLEVVKTDSDDYLPVGFKAEIIEVRDGDLKMQDTGGYGSHYYIEYDEGTICNFTLKLSDGFPPAVPPVKTSVAQRKKLAKAIKEARKVLDQAVLDAEAVGMQISENGNVICFNPPIEQY